MSIELSFQTTTFDKEQFLELNHMVMGIAFQIHNQYGNQLPEKVYRDELAFRCESKGLSVRKEARILLRSGDFHKPFYCDLVLAACRTEI